MCSILFPPLPQYPLNNDASSPKRESFLGAAHRLGPAALGPRPARGAFSPAPPSSQYRRLIAKMSGAARLSHENERVILGVLPPSGRAGQAPPLQTAGAASSAPT